MSLERHFLGWDGPALPRAAVWLAQRYASGRDLDLSHVVVVTPTSRSARRLLDWLVEESRVHHLLLTPPRIETLGRLPELLYDASHAIADDLFAVLARVHALRTAEHETLASLFSRPPEKDDEVGWWNLATQLRAFNEDLAAARLLVGDVPTRARDVGLDLRREAHFDLLAQLESRYQDILSEAGLCDRQAARLDALANGRCRCESDVVLVAAVDLSPLAAAMLRAAASERGVDETAVGGAGGVGGVVAALIHASEEHGAGFDDLGNLRVPYWSNQPVDLVDEAVRFVDRPADQARAARAAIPHARGLAAGAKRRMDDTSAISPDAATIGLGDQALAGTIKRALEMAGIPARFGAGRPLLRSRPALALAALSRFVDQFRFDDFAQLLRHPDIEVYLRNETHPGDASHRGITHWITLLDDYAHDHLQHRVDGQWLGDENEQALLKDLWQRVMQLLPDDASQLRPLCHWTLPILDALRQIYGDIELTPASPTDQPLITALETLAQTLRDQAGLDPAAPTTPCLTFSQAVDLTLARLSEAAIPEEAGDPAVELMGYLELQLDDAPQLIITSMNEGSIPAAHHDAGLAGLLPDHVRSALGLTDNARLAARDRMMLEVIIRSRPSVTLIAGRTSSQGDPLTPSRLLLACDENTMARRIRRFYRQQFSTPLLSESASEGAGIPRSPLAPPPSSLTPATDAFLIPFPSADAPILNRLPVTAFRTFIACPYRFYLQYVCRLKGIDDQAAELDALAFGSLAHQALEAFGQSDLSDSTQADDIADFLSHTLDRAAAGRYGDAASWRPALRIQVEQLRERLTAFAHRQATWAGEGWRIIQTDVEQRIERALDIDGEVFTITGRVDRIDRHPDYGYRILDYKTSDTGKRPDQTHRRRIEGNKQWIDLQLPLYGELCAQAPLNVTGHVELGYINLPKNLSDVGLALADWTKEELDKARTLRDDIIRCIRRREFWEPKDPPRWADNFSGICADDAIDRKWIIEQSGGNKNHR